MLREAAATQVTPGGVAALDGAAFGGEGSLLRGLRDHRGWPRRSRQNRTSSSEASSLATGAAGVAGAAALAISQSLRTAAWMLRSAAMV